MSITYPLDFPAIGIKGATIRYAKVVGVTTSPFAFNQTVYEWPGERWEADIDWPLMTRDKAEALQAWLLALRGSVGSCLLTPANSGTPKGAAALAPGTPQLDGDQAALARQIDIKTGLGNVAAYLKAGDFIQLGAGNGTRLHRVLADVALVGGKATLDIVPPLREAQADGAAVAVANCKGKFMLSSASVQHTINVARQYQPGSLTFVEDLRPIT